MRIVVQGQEFDVQPGADSVTVEGVDYPVRIVRQGDSGAVYVNERPYQVQLPSATAEEGPVKLLVDAKEDEVELKGAPSAASRAPRAAAHRAQRFADTTPAAARPARSRRASAPPRRWPTPS